ncbi:Trigger factor [Buchnera aphidicola (Neophyllaphis podocarpi)]|uniref:trigger factor n=1 Tax=Buchnera aphidicola TaxID=9 RepID=UPI003463D68E
MNKIEKIFLIKIKKNEIKKEKNKIIKNKNSFSVNGFRRGKIPEKIIKSKYKDYIEKSAIKEILKNKIAKILYKKNINIDTEVSISELHNNTSDELTYKIYVNTYPNINLSKILDSIEIEKNVLKITDEDIQYTINSLRYLNAKWKTKEKTIQKSDKIKIELKCYYKNKILKKFSIKNLEFIVGNNNLIKEIDKIVINKKLHEEFKINNEFINEKYNNKFNKKNLKIFIKINKIKEMILPKVNKKFIQKIGIKKPSIKNFHEEIKQIIQNETKKIVQKQIKFRIIQKIIKLNPINFPDTIIKKEISKIKHLNIKNEKQSILTRFVTDKEYYETAIYNIYYKLILKEIKELYKKENKNYKSKILNKKNKILNNNKFKIEEKTTNTKLIEELIIENHAIKNLLKKIKFRKKICSFKELIKQ